MARKKRGRPRKVGRPKKSPRKRRSSRCPTTRKVGTIRAAKACVRAGKGHSIAKKKVYNAAVRRLRRSKAGRRWLRQRSATLAKVPAGSKPVRAGRRKKRKKAKSRRGPGRPRKVGRPKKSPRKRKPQRCPTTRKKGTVRAAKACVARGKGRTIAARRTFNAAVRRLRRSKKGREYLKRKGIKRLAKVPRGVKKVKAGRGRKKRRGRRRMKRRGRKKRRGRRRMKRRGRKKRRGRRRMKRGRRRKARRRKARRRRRVRR